MVKGLTVISQGAKLQAVDASGNVRELISGDRLLPGETLSVSGGKASIMMPDGTMISVADGQTFLLPENGIPLEQQPQPEPADIDAVAGEAPAAGAEAQSTAEDPVDDTEAGGGTLLSGNNSGMGAPKLVDQDMALDGGVPQANIPGFGQSGSQISGGQYTSVPRSSGFSTASAATPEAKETAQAINIGSQPAASESFVHDLDALRAAMERGPSDSRNFQSLQSEYQEVNIDPDDLAMLVNNGHLGCIIEAPNTLTLISGESTELIRMGAIEGIDLGPSGTFSVEMINGELYAFGESAYYTIDIATLQAMNMGPHNLPEEVTGMTAAPMGGMYVSCSDGGLYHFDPAESDTAMPVNLSMPDGNGMLFDMEMVNGELYATGFANQGEWHIFRLEVGTDGSMIASQLTSDPMPEPAAQLFVQNGALYGVTDNNMMMSIDLESGEVTPPDQMILLDDFALLNSDFLAIQEMQAMEMNALPQQPGIESLTPEQMYQPEPITLEQIDFQQIQEEVHQIMGNEELLQEYLEPGQTLENINEGALESALEDQLIQNIMDEQQQLEDEFYHQQFLQEELQYQQQQTLNEFTEMVQESIEEGEQFDPENFMEFGQYQDLQLMPEFQEVMNHNNLLPPDPNNPMEPQFSDDYLQYQDPLPDPAQVVNVPNERQAEPGNELMNFGEQPMVFNINDNLQQNNGQELFIAEPVMNQGQQGTEFISGFNPFENQGEVLDLSDMLPEDAIDNLDQYLQISFENGNTTISVSESEGGPAVQNYVLEDVDLSQTFGTTDVVDITNQLWDNGSLQL